MKKSNDDPAMKPDEFEQQIAQRPMRSVPAEWREEILAAARSAATRSNASRSETPAKSWLHSIFWPCPQAWAGLAAVWLALAVFHHFTGSTENKTIQMAKTPVDPVEMKMGYEQQKRELAQLLQGLYEPAAEPPKPYVPRPRSDCRRLMGWA